MASDHHHHARDLHPKCVGTAGDAFRGPADGYIPASERLPGDPAGKARANIFRAALFSRDGTTIITQSEDHRLRTFVLPTDLLDGSQEPEPEPKHLSPYATWNSSNTIQSYALYPGFDLQNPATTLALCGSADVPITLRNVLDYDTVHATYPFVSSTTEKHLPPRSLAFTRDGSQFLTGSDNTLATFDCSRSTEGPITFLRMRPGKHRVGNGLGKLNRKGIVSALNISNEGLLAVGTLQREVALYEHDGLGAFATSFELEDGLGTGIIDLRWSPHGTYLLIAERQSDVIQIYDVRNTHLKVASLNGRQAMTTQPLHIDVVPTAAGYEVWGGGTDGHVRMWSNPGSQQGDQPPDAELRLHDAPVSSAIWHPAGAVMATASGRRYRETSVSDEDSDDSASDDVEPDIPDNSMKIWTV